MGNRGLKKRQLTCEAADLESGTSVRRRPRLAWMVKEGRCFRRLTDGSTGRPIVWTVGLAAERTITTSMSISREITEPGTRLFLSSSVRPVTVVSPRLKEEGELYMDE